MQEEVLRRRFLGKSALWGAAAALPSSWLEKPAPAERVYSVRGYGAAGDGERLDTRAIQSAIEDCARAGGGTVFFPAGRYLSGTLFLRSQVGFFLSAGATLLGSKRLEDYPPRLPAFKAYTSSEIYANRYLIYGENVENIFIAGQGTIDGQGASFERKPLGRPYLIRFSECSQVSVEGVTFKDSPMWVQHYLACTSVIIRGIRVHSHVNSNNDGIDIDCCDRVCISDCEIDTGDDAIVLKSGGERKTSNVTVTNCVLRSRWCALKTGTESEGGFENIAISNCVIHDTRSAGIALEMVDGGTLESVVVSNLTMKGVNVPIFIRFGDRGRAVEPGGARRPIDKVGVKAGNIFISNIEASGAGDTGCSITGLPGHPVRNVSLSNIRLSFAGGGAQNFNPVDENPEAYPNPERLFGKLPAYGFYCRHADGLRFANVETRFEQSDSRPGLVCDDVHDLEVFACKFAVAPKGAPPILLRDVRNAMIHGCRASQELEAALRIEGRSTEGVTLLANEFRLAKKAIDLAPDVPGGAVLSEASRR